MTALCPVCRRLVQRTDNRLIEPHMDSMNWEECPGSREPFRIAIAADPELQLLATIRDIEHEVRRSA